MATLHDGLQMIWLTDNKLHSKEGTTKTESRLRELDKVTSPSPVSDDVLPLAINIIVWDEVKYTINDQNHLSYDQMHLYQLSKYYS